MGELIATLARAHELGMTVATDGQRLVIKGRPSPEAEAVARTLGEHKSEVLALLRRQCCATCESRRLRPDPLGDGCESHGVTPEAVAERWSRVKASDDPALCLCCAGPTANTRDFVCARCCDCRTEGARRP